MIEQDTIRLMRECDAGIKMGVSSIDDVIDYVIPECTQSGKVFFVRGKGIKTSRGTGDLYIEVVVEMPAKVSREQKKLFDSFIDTLAASIDARDKITSGHSTRVRMYATLIAEAFNMSANEIEIIQKAAALHDIGKIGIKDSVLQKEGKLTPEEYQHIQQHVEITHNILEKIHMSEEFSLITEIACSHHEKYDGTGYYRQLKGEEIPFGGRVLAVSDVFDAITSKRHYRDKMPIKNALDIIKSGSWKHFDGNVVEAFFNIK